MKSPTYKSPAKINLRLDIIGKRADGFHELRMIMVPITLFDEITFTLTHSKKIDIDSDKKDLINEDNLIFKAIKLFQKKYSKIRDSGFQIYLQKNIPIGAGLGGGSGNAATTILALNELCNLNLTQERMVELGAELGSDVPFFIYQRPAIVTGRGEKVTPIENFPLYYGILIYPNIAISTKKMYAAFDLQLTKERLNVSNHEFLAHIQELEFTSSLEFFHNDFDSLCVSLYPEIAEVKALFLESNALLAQVSGSGSSVFGIYENEKEQADAYTWLKNRCKDTNYNIEIIKTLGDASHQNLAPST